MHAEELKKKWDYLRSQKLAGNIISIRISAECIPELNLGLNRDGNRCLILFPPVGMKHEFVSQKKENLSIYFHNQEKCIILELTDNHYDELFDDLILSLYSKIYKISDMEKSARLFLSNISRWSSFLASSSERLSEEAVKGIIGELSVLNQFIDESPSSGIDDVLSSWKGLYDATTDFEFDGKNVEVKTKNLDRTVVKISSEYQLSKVSGKELHLAVVSVIKAHNQGISLKDMVSNTRAKIEDAGGNSSTLFDALAQKGLFSNNLKDYDRYRFSLKNHTFYDCEKILDNGERFPRITVADIGEQVSKVSYRINLSELDGFLISKKEV